MNTVCAPERGRLTWQRSRGGRRNSKRPATCLRRQARKQHWAGWRGQFRSVGTWLGRWMWVGGKCETDSSWARSFISKPEVGPVGGKAIHSTTVCVILDTFASHSRTQPAPAVLRAKIQMDDGLRAANRLRAGSNFKSRFPVEGNYQELPAYLLMNARTQAIAEFSSARWRSLLWFEGQAGPTQPILHELTGVRSSRSFGSVVGVPGGTRGP